MKDQLFAWPVSSSTHSFPWCSIRDILGSPINISTNDIDPRLTNNELRDEAHVIEVSDRIYNDIKHNINDLLKEHGF
jgi:hypothetical protein